MNEQRQETLPAPTTSLWQTFHDPAAFQRCVLARLLAVQRGRVQMVRPRRSKSKPVGTPAPLAPQPNQQAADDVAHRQEQADYQAFVSRSHQLGHEQLEVDRHNFAGRFRDR